MITNNADTMSYDSLDRLYRNQNTADWVFLHNGSGERLVKFPGSTSLARREMARLVGEANKAAGKTGWSTAPDSCISTFADVPCTDADAGWIQTVYNHGTTAGCGGSNFCPDPPTGTLNRAQMAVFIVKGYRADGAATPACTGIFADVPCSGGSQWVPFAPYIEQLSRDNVTAGCGGSNFCPGNPVTPWQILVWMSKTPAVPGGVTWASVYHPVPRGSIYTLRDEQNRVVTEMTAASSGSASATLNVQRDNVFFGNLLVASNSLGNWNFDVSDHLGSPRVLWDSTGAVTESHKYWPFGEDITSALNQHIAFQSMERNDAVSQHFDHARTQHYSVGRFVSTDPLLGVPLRPQSWNRYAFALNNPLRFVDPDGNSADEPETLGDRFYDFMSTFFAKCFPAAITSSTDPNAQAMADESVGNSPDQAERMANPAGVAQRGLNEAGATLAAKAAEEITTQGAILLVAGAGHLIGKGFEVGEHALMRMEERGVSAAQVERLLATAEPFVYRHDGMVKSGYYDSASRLFVAVVDKTVKTVMTGVRPQYIENLKRLP